MTSKCFQISNIIVINTYIYLFKIGGNQRDLARERNAKKQSATKSSETDANKGLSIEERRLR